jgi:hypothetical protein
MLEHRKEKGALEPRLLLVLSQMKSMQEKLVLWLITHTHLTQSQPKGDKRRITDMSTKLSVT